MGTMITGGGIPLYRALVMRSAIKLEAQGIRMTRRSMRMQCARELGMPGRPKVDAVLAALEEHIGRLEAALKPGEIRAIGDDPEAVRS